MKYSKKKNKIFTLLMITAGMLVIAGSVLAAADFSFALSREATYEVGNTFRTNIVIFPAGKIYTVKAQINYPANLLKIESFTFNSNWMPVSQPGYDVVDNNSGLLIKTAGYPGGTDSEVVLGTLKFRILNPGKATLKFASDSLILDANNANIAKSSASLDLTLTSVPVSETPAEEEKITPLTEEEISSPTEEVATPEKEAVVVLPKEKTAGEGLASALVALGMVTDEISQSSWKIIIVILCLIGLIIVGVKEWKKARGEKKKNV